MTSWESNTMGSKGKYILLLMLAMSLEMALANDTESVDLFTLLDETCPYWQVQYSKFYRQAQLYLQS